MRITGQVEVMEINRRPDHEERFSEIVREIWAVLGQVKRIQHDHSYDGIMQRTELLAKANVLWAIGIEVAREGVGR